MNPGLGMGFVKFGTLAHKILLLMHELGDLRHGDLVVELPEHDPRHIAMVLIRLRDNGFTWPKDRDLKYDTGYTTQWIYGLEPNLWRQYKPVATSAERSARYRDKKRAQQKMNFVFNIGRMEVR